MFTGKDGMGRFCKGNKFAKLKGKRGRSFDASGSLRIIESAKIIINIREALGKNNNLLEDENNNRAK